MGIKLLVDERREIEFRSSGGNPLCAILGVMFLGLTAVFLVPMLIAPPDLSTLKTEIAVLMGILLGIFLVPGLVLIHVALRFYYVRYEEGRKTLTLRTRRGLLFRSSIEEIPLESIKFLILVLEYLRNDKTGNLARLSMALRLVVTRPGKARDGRFALSGLVICKKGNRQTERLIDIAGHLARMARVRLVGPKFLTQPDSPREYLKMKEEDRSPVTLFHPDGEDSVLGTTHAGSE